MVSAASTRAPLAGVETDDAPAPPLIALRGIRKSYGGDTPGPDGKPLPAVDVLRGIDLTIHAGEFVAIVGASGSGKSTLMNILGCLDRPSSGEYRFGGRDIAHFDADELAWLRREAFGFVFQGYHLIATESARENVEVPAIYAGVPAAERERRATELLTRLGLGERLANRPNQLSGGQQQRVSISRALMNGGHIVLADEPTGALDSKSGADVMQLLTELAAAGHTIIVITHDRQVAARARRSIEIRDGRIVSDSGAVPRAADAPVSLDAASLMSTMADGVAHAAPLAAEIRDAARAAWRVLWINRFRTLLTLLGIIIGVTSVIAMLAIGAGTERQVIAKMASFGTNRMYVTPGGDNPRSPGGALTLDDVDLVREVPGVSVAMPFVRSNATVRFSNRDVTVPVWGVSERAPTVLHWDTARGIFFGARDVHDLATVAVIGKRVREKLFGDDNPLGRYVLVSNVPFQVIGELTEKGATSGDSDDDNVILIPYTSVARRLVGTTNLSWISVLIDNLDLADAIANRITQVLEDSHHMRDFQVFNAAASVKAQAETQNTLTLMLGLIAAISLLVGGIGVMNIMLMTVRERTREIGIRIATGARQRDIMRQFLTEATLVSGVGGLLGVTGGLAVGATLIACGVPAIFSIRAIVGAFACALATGLIFGFMPARQAARLDPVVALTGE